MHRTRGEGPSSPVLACRYVGLTDHPRLRLTSERIIRTPARLIHQLDALPPVPRGAMSCPAEDGSEVLLRLRYPARTLDVIVGLSGCRTARNGSVVRAASDPALKHELTAARAAHPARASSS